MALLKLLVVEDNMINQEVMKGYLEDHEVIVDVADDGKQALDMLSDAPNDSPFEIIFMDCQMPVMDGYEATQKIREGVAGDRYKSIPIIAMTANAMKGDKEKCLEAGMDDYRAKPIELDDISEVLIKWGKKT